MANKIVSTHSRPKAAGQKASHSGGRFYVSTHSRPKAAGSGIASVGVRLAKFQLTAARRRLAGMGWQGGIRKDCFNSQPPEGGWINTPSCLPLRCGFNSQPPEGGWFYQLRLSRRLRLFQLTAARRRLATMIMT